MRSMPKVDINRLAFLENPLPSLVLEGNGRVATLNEEARMLLGGQTEGRLIQRSSRPERSGILFFCMDP